MSDVTIYHNPKCSKSRQTLALLLERGLEPQVIEYLSAPPSAQTLAVLVKKMGLEPRELIRRKEYNDLGLPPTDDAEALLELMARHPKIMQRPIVVCGSKACLGRPPEKVLEIL